MGQEPRPAPLLLVLAGGLVVGAPMVWVIWHNLSELLAGRPDGRGLLVSAILLPAFLLLARALARTVQRRSAAP